MAVPATYATLQTELADWLSRDDATTQIVNAIGYAEARFNRQLFGPEREATSTLSASAETVALPADFWSIRTAECTTVPRRSLQQVTLSDLRDMYPAASTGRPEDYAIVGSNMYLGPIPNGTYSIIINYYTSVPALISNTAGNWLLTAHPDLYISACLTELYLLFKDEERAALWDSRTMAKIAEINKLGVKKRHGATPLGRRTLVADVSRYFSA